MIPIRVAALAAALLLTAPGARAQQDTARTARTDTAQLDRPRRREPRDTGAARADTGAVRAASPTTRFLEAFTFRNLGPAAYSGRVTAIAVPAGSRHTIYIGSAGGGVWKTTNGGVTWVALSDSLGASTIGDVTVAPSDTNIVWVGTGERNSLRSQMWGAGVAKSTDGGKAWHRMGLEDTRSIGRIVIHPTNPDIVYVGALGHLWGTNRDRGLYKTTDGGRTWAKVLFVDDTSGVIDVVMDRTNPDVLYAATWHRLRWGGGHMEGTGAGSAIWKTTDGGKSWTRLTDRARPNGLPSEHIGRVGLAIAPQDPRTVYAMIQVDRGIVSQQKQGFGGVFRSDDAGATWTHVNDLEAWPHYYYDAIVVDPSNADHVYVLASPLLESKDGGKSFAVDSMPMVHVDNHALWIDPASPRDMILGNDGGVYITHDGGAAWDHQRIPIGQFYTVIVDSARVPYHVCGGLQDNGVWCGPSATRDSLGIADADWTPVNGGDGMWVQVPPDDPNTVYSAWQFGNLSRLDRRTGQRDDIQPLALDAGAESGYAFTWGWTTPLLYSQHEPGVLYVGANRLIKMSDRGDDWTVLGPDMTRNDRRTPAPEHGYTSYHAIFSIAESPRDGRILWTGSDDGLVWVTRDGGATWANVTGSLPKTAPTQCWVSTIAASHHADGTAYLTYDCHFRDDYRPYVYRTTDFGRTWTALAHDLPASAGSFTILESAFNPRMLWVGNAHGVWASIDGGAHWQRFGKNLPLVPVERLALAYAERDLVVATHGRGIWIANVAATSDASDSLLASAAHLFEVPPAYQYRYRPEAGMMGFVHGNRPFLASNPPRGAEITYWLREAQPEAVKMLITTAAGDTVKHLTGPGYAGLQHVTWDLTRDRPRPREKGGPTDRAELRRVEPGGYVLHLTVGKSKLEQPIVVRDWPQEGTAPR